MTTDDPEPQRAAAATADPADAYELHARRCDERDFWGQVRRTVGGQPLPEAQIALIEEAIVRLLDLQAADRLVDLCCGNGALGARWFARCRGGVGVDCSETLVGIARLHFDLGPQVAYRVADVVAFAQTAPEAARFDKAVLYGSVAYLPRDRVALLLAALRERFAGLSRLVIGNVPDRARLHDFFGDRYEAGIEDRPDSAIGIWWSLDEMAEAAAGAGWHATFSRMPEPFYAHSHRFDVVLTPDGEKAF